VATIAGEIQMPIKFEYTCPDCVRTVEWIFNEEEERLEPDGVTGCLGKNCMKIHRASAMVVSEERAEKVKQSGL